MTRIYEYVCPYCEKTKTTDLKPPAGLSCGEGTCADAHNEAVRQWHIDNPRTRRAPRKRTTGAVGDGSWAFIGALNGYRPKGTNNGV